MDYSFGDVCDRLTILQLKKERIGGNKFDAELDAFAAAYMQLLPQCRDLDVVTEMFLELKKTNGKIWDLEADIRMGREGMLGLEEVGRRAIAIRETNERRVQIKNRLNTISKTGFQEFRSTFRV